MVVRFILLILSAYLIGSIPSAYLIARWRRGIDIRQYGSGNVGASNVLATVSRLWSIPVVIFDLAKGALMVWVAQSLGLNVAQQITVGLAAVAGHNWSIFLRFSGGRGIFTSLGVLFVLEPILGLYALITAYLLAPFRQLSLGVTIALVSLPILSWFLSKPLDIEEPLAITLGVIALLLITMIKRLTAPRATIAASLSTGELILNRLLFDRDIRDRKAWISRAPETGSGKSPAVPDKDKEAAR
jgi:glycerol-3-phosphate acyltransferase PlsY